MRKRIIEKQITNIYDMVTAYYPKINLDDHIYWDKEVHNYRLKLYNEIAILYRRVWENRFDLRNSIMVEVINNKMVVTFEKGFLKYLEELYPNAKSEFIV